MPEMQALSERLHEVLTGTTLCRANLLGFSSLKTYAPTPESLYHQTLISVSRRAKYLVWEFENGCRIVLHLSQAGRLDIEYPPKKTKPRGAAVRFEFARDEEGPESANIGVLVREYGTQR
jgi:formamidopyrimidine-DNA glycosylase